MDAGPMREFERALDATADGTATQEQRSRAAACMVAVALHVLDAAPYQSAAWLRAVADGLETQRGGRLH